MKFLDVMINLVASILVVVVIYWAIKLITGYTMNPWECYITYYISLHTAGSKQ
jgi:hypothetical protein